MQLENIEITLVLVVIIFNRILRSIFDEYDFELINSIQSLFYIAQDLFVVNFILCYCYKIYYYFDALNNRVPFI